MANPLPLPVGALERRLGVEEGTLDGPDKARAEDALRGATAHALAEAPAAVAARWEAESLPEVVRDVILRAARREYENPQGLTSEALGERSVGIGNTSGSLLTAREAAIVRRAARGRSGFVGSVRTPSAYDYPETRRRA